MKLRYIIMFAVAAISAASCSKMNDNIDQYLSQGEIIYIAKADSVHLYAGKERFKMEFWMRDPRATEMRIYWSQKSDSLVVPISADRDFDEPVTVIVDKNVPEGQYSLNLVTFDKLGNKSVVDEQNVSVYGNLFQQSLFNRYVDSFTLNAAAGTATIVWGNCYSTKEYSVNVSYTDLQGIQQESVFLTSELGQSSVLTNVDVTKEISYTTVYLPEPTAIDMFYTPSVVLK